MCATSFRVRCFMRQRSSWSPILLVATGAVGFVLFGYVVYPSLAVLWQSLGAADGWTLSHYGRFFSFTSSANLLATWNSVLVSCLSVILAALIGVPLAFLLSTFDFPGRKACSALVSMPIVLPPLVGVLAFVFLLGESGLVPRGLSNLTGSNSASCALTGIAGVVAVHGYSFSVFFFTFVSSALENRDTSLTEAAASLGAGKWLRLRRVTLPLLMPALVGAAIIVFMTSMASFSAPLLFAGELRVLSVQLYSTRLSGDLRLAAVQSVVLSGVSLAFLFALRYWNNRRRVTMATKGTRGRRRSLPRGLTRWLIPSAGFVVSVIMVLPHLTLVLLSFIKQGTWTFRSDAWFPAVFTVENYRMALSLARPLANSIQMAFFATLGNLVVGVFIGWLLAVKRIRFGNVVDALVMLPWALPGTVVAVNLLTAFSTGNVFSFGQVLAGSVWLLPLAYFVRNLPVVARSAQSAFVQIDPSLEEAARSLGAGWWLRFRRVTLPLIAPGVLGGAMLAFVTALGEFVASVLLWVPANQPISMAIFGEYREYRLEVAAAYGVLLVAFIGLVFFVSRVAFGSKAASEV